MNGVGLIVATPGRRISDSGRVNTNMLINIFSKYHKFIYLFTEAEFDDNKLKNALLIKAKKPFKRAYFPLRLLGHLLFEVELSWHVLRNSNKIDIYYFTELLLPIITAKLRKKKIVFLIGGSGFREYMINQPTRYNAIWTEINRLRRNFIYYLSNYIIVYSNYQLDFDRISSKGKALTWHYVYLDFNIFKRNVELSNRKMIVGYVGSISKIKGIYIFISAIPLILEKNKNINFLIIGEGPDLIKVKEFIKKNNLAKNVELIGWVSNEDLPIQYNKMKLFVNPSFTEGIPKTILEAMACGTPVLATPVGGIPEIIKDNQTGFILNNLSSEDLSKKILNILTNHELCHIAEKGEELIKLNYNFNYKIFTYKKILDILMED